MNGIKPPFPPHAFMAHIGKFGWLYLYFHLQILLHTFFCMCSPHSTLFFAHSYSIWYAVLYTKHTVCPTLAFLLPNYSITATCFGPLLWPSSGSSQIIIKKSHTCTMSNTAPNQRTVESQNCRVQLKYDGPWWHTGGEVKGTLANEVGKQYSSHYLGTWCTQHYYLWCAQLGYQQSTELTPPLI